MSSIANVKLSTAGESLPCAPRAGWHHAVEHIYAAFDCADNICRRAHSHKVAGLSMGQVRHREIQGHEHLILRFTDGETTNGVSIKPDSGKTFGGLLS